MSNMFDNVVAEIDVQPESKSMRFRYVSEGPTAGSLVGVNSSEDNKIYPAIRIRNYDGAARVIVSCVTDDKIPKPHPNSLIGAKWCNHGVYYYDFTAKSAEPTVVKFKRIGIQRPKKEHLGASLDEREKQRIDPFRTGFDHKLRPKSINLTKVRLCFQVFLVPDLANPKRLISLKPFVSNVIVDKQAINTRLYIHEISDNSSTPSGKKKIMLFCSKVDKNDIGIKFFEVDAADKIVWEDWASFKPKNVHKQVAISFKPPRYRVQAIDAPVTVFFCLQTLKGKPTCSNSIEFHYVPDPSSSLNTKKRKIDDSRSLYEYLEVNEVNDHQKSMIESKIQPNEAGHSENCAPEMFNVMDSSFDASKNNLMLPIQPLHYENINPQSQYEQYQPPQQSNFEWSSPQPRQPLQTYNNDPQQVHRQNQFEDRSCQEPYSYHHQYQPMSQSVSQSQNETAPNIYGRHSSHHSTYNRYVEPGNVYGTTNNLSADNNANWNRQTQPIGNYQTPLESSHHPCQRIGPVITAKEVIIQQFCNNNVTINQPQHQQPTISEIFSNFSDYLGSDQNVL